MHSSGIRPTGQLFIDIATCRDRDRFNGVIINRIIIINNPNRITNKDHAHPHRRHVSPALTDAGCPNINDTSFSPLDAQGKAIPLRAGAAAQSFLRFCDTNWPAGAEHGNPGIHDIMKVYLS